MTKRVSNPRRRYLAARRRGLSQSEAMKEVGVSRSSAWRYDQLWNHEEAARAAVLERVEASRAARENEKEDVLREAQAQDVSISGPATFPEPPVEWGGSRSRATPPMPSAEESLVEDESYPAGLLERRQRASQGSPQPPRAAPGAVVMGRGKMDASEPNMGSTLFRPARLPEEPPNMLGGVV
jgi:hypothetical protein